MEYIIKRKADIKESKWMGGSTTELFIYPPYSSYKERNFDVRVSVATIEESPSNFTLLPSFHRILMPLTNDIELIFEKNDCTNYQNDYNCSISNKIYLRMLTSIAFDGGIGTVSYGKCKDIGVMFKDGYKATIECAKEDKIKIFNGITIIYALESLNLMSHAIEATLNNGDFCYIESTNEEEISLNHIRENTAIVVRIYKEN